MAQTTGDDQPCVLTYVIIPVFISGSGYSSCEVAPIKFSEFGILLVADSCDDAIFMNVIPGSDGVCGVANLKSRYTSDNNASDSPIPRRIENLAADGHILVKKGLVKP